MNFPRFWAKAAGDKLECWRWSDLSADDARAQAETALGRLLERLRNTGQKPAAYGYADRPLREEVLREFRDATGQLTAVITRNAPGCQVLNTARALFVDIDFPEPKPPGFFASLKRLFSPAPPPKPAGPGLEAIALAKARAWADARPGWSWRAYRTRAGLRLLATHDLFEPQSPAVAEVFEALGSDPLYRRLCKAQQSFRARLTPKPWRCGLTHLPVAWPWLEAHRANVYLKWNEKYQQASAGFATCRLVATIGEERVHPDIRPLIAVHDDLTRISQPLELA